MTIPKEEKKALVEAIRAATTPVIANDPHIVICGPSGSGKSTLIRNDPQSIMKLKSDIYSVSVSGATREKRKSEIDGLDYHFMTNADFGMADFFETNEYPGNKKLYGTLVSELERIAIHMKKRILFDIDPNGAMVIQEYFGKDVFVVFLYTSDKVLRTRLTDRLEKTGETMEDVEKRIITAGKERKMVEDNVFVPNLILPYDNMSVGEGVNLILFKSKEYMLQMV